MVKNKKAAVASEFPLPEQGLAALWRLAKSRGICRDTDEFAGTLEKMARGLFPGIGKWVKNISGLEGGKAGGESWRSIGDVCWRKGAEREERRLAGSFYTPDFLIDRILDLLWEEIIPGVMDPDKAITVCDPAMGCGFFLLRLVERLKEKRISAERIAEWVSGNVYGVDKDANAVFLARSLLWVTLSEPGAVFWPDPGKLCCGDSLLGPGFGQGGKGNGVMWGKAFPEIASAGGFGVVFGNPPYEVLTNFARNPAAKRYAEKLRSSGWYKDSLKGQINLYRCFIERGLGLVRDGGALSFVVPLSLARDGVAVGLRKRLLLKDGAEEWLLYGEGESGFDGVIQSVCVFAARKGKGAAKRVRVESSKGIGELEVDELEGFGGGVAAIPEVGAAELRLWRWIRENVAGTLGKAVEMRVGEVDQTVYRDCMRDEDTGCLLARGGHLQPFVLDSEAKAGKERFLDKARFWAKKGGVKRTLLEKIEVERVVQLGIRNMKTRPRLVAAVAPPGVYLGNSLNVFYPRNGMSSRCLCGVLNSRLLDWMFCLGSGNNNINLREMAGLPFPDDFDKTAALGVEKATERCIKAAIKGADGAGVRSEMDRHVEALYRIPAHLLNDVFGT